MGRRFSAQGILCLLVWRHRFPVPWGHPPPWSHQVAPVGSDHLYNFLTAAGAVVAILSFIVGVVVAVLYRHKANLGIKAEVAATDSGTVLAVRPSVSAVGPFKLKFADEHGAVVQVRRVFATDKGGTATEQSAWKRRNAFPADETGQRQFVSPGESLSTTTLFRVDPQEPKLLGWLVSLNIASKGVIRHGLHWAERVFVPVTSPFEARGGSDAGTEAGGGQAGT